MKDTIMKIAQYAHNKANLPEFQHVFGPDLGDHLWEKFESDYSRDFLEFFGAGLDEDNKLILAKRIEDL